jgi:predicted permease
VRWRRSHNRERDLERELRAHLDLEAEEFENAGLSAADARHSAQRALGNFTRIQEDIRAMTTLTVLDDLAKDLRYALRSMRANPGFAAAAILSLALGIGANTAIFTLIDSLLLRSLPVPNPEQLVQLQLVELGRPGNSIGYPAIGALANRTDIFAGVAGFSSASFNVSEHEGSERVGGAWVSGGYYPTLALRPIAGRLLTTEDDRPGAPPAAVLSYRYWQKHYNRDFGVVGRSVSIEGKPVAIVGVSPEGFLGANVGDAADLTLPLAVLAQLYPERAQQLESGSQWLRVLARPLPGVSMTQAKARLDVAWPRMAPIATTPRMNPKRRDALLHSSIELVPGGTGWSGLRDRFRRPLLILMAMTGLVLLIACANFANLLLARGAARSREIALRFAIGAGRGRVVRQLLTESILLSTCGAILGLWLAGIGGRLLVTLLANGRRDGILLDLAPDARVLLFTSAVALATGILFGLVPALRATASGPALALKGAGALSRPRSRFVPALVVSQVALSLVLLVGAGLFVRTLENLQRLDPGFRSEGVLLVNLDARRAGYKDARLAAFYQGLLDRFAHLPGVVSASLSSNTPLSGGIWSDAVTIDGQPTRESAHFNSVAPHYFETLGTALVAGRDFDAHDRPGAANVAVVSEAFARRYLAGGPVLGRQFSIPNPRYAPFEIVGVVKDTVSQNLRLPAPAAVYLPYFQLPDMIGIASFEVRAHGSLAQTADRLRDEVRAELPSTPVQYHIQALDEQVKGTLIQERLLAALGSCFGALALLLAAVGLYGLLAYMVTRATAEIGIRIALGARRPKVLGLVFGSAFRLLGAGILVGIPAAWAGSRIIASSLFGLSGTDPLTLAAAAGLLLLTALLAALLPAVRASRVDPMVALRHE